jgi:hypothetical protein
LKNFYFFQIYFINIPIPESFRRKNERSFKGSKKPEGHSQFREFLVKFKFPIQVSHTEELKS